MVRMLLIEAVYSNPTENNHPPLGLTYIASSLRRYFGDTFQFKVFRDSPDRLYSEIRDFNPNIVGISSVTKNYNVAKEHASIAKLYKLPVIIGGVHVSFLPQTITRDMDVGIMGEGERTIIDLMDAFLCDHKFYNDDLNDIKGIAYWEGRSIKTTQPRGFISSIDTIPYPARYLLPIDAHTGMLSSRGCPYNCSFCSTSRLTGNKARYASPEYVVEEIKILHCLYGVTYITIYDDMFALSVDRVARIVDLLKKECLIGKLRYALNIRTDFVNEDMADLFLEMGVHAVGLGVESGCQRTLDYLKSGGITVEDNSRAIRLLQKRGIIPYCSLIIGSPNESKAELWETVKFIKRNNVKYLDVNILTPFPGTPVWEYAERKGLVSDRMDWHKLNFDINYEPIILSENISKNDLQVVKDKLIGIKQKAIRRKKKWLVIKNPRRYLKLLLNSMRGDIKDDLDDTAR